jgi:hypothetical protein
MQHSCDETARMVANFRRLKAINPNVTTLAYFSTCANFPHYATAATFAAQPSLLLHNSSGGFVHTHVPGFTWPAVTVFDVSQPAARKVIVDACVAAVATGAVDGFFLDRVDDGCFQRDYGHTLDPAKSAALPQARETLAQEIQAAIGAERLVVANHMFALDGVSGAMDEAWSVGHGANGAAGIWQTLAECDKANKAVEAHCSNDNLDSIAAFLIGAGPLALFGTGSWSFTGSAGPAWSDLYDKPLGKPLGPAVLQRDPAGRGNVSMVRHFARGTTVSFCLNTSKGAIQWGQ